MGIFPNTLNLGSFNLPTLSLPQMKQPGGCPNFRNSTVDKFVLHIIHIELNSSPLGQYFWQGIAEVHYFGPVQKECQIMT